MTGGLWLWLVGAAAAEGPIALVDAQRFAVERSLQVERARAEADAARQDAWEAVGGALPAVAGFGSAGVGAGTTTSGFTRSAGLISAVGVSASWALVDAGSWGAASAARRSAEGQDAMARWAMVSARQQATDTWLGAWLAAAQVAALERAAQQAQESADAVSALVGAGLRAPADGAQARAEAAAVAARLATARGDQGASCAALLAFIRQEVGPACEVGPLAAGEPGAAAVEHPALSAARAALDTQQASRRAAQGSLLPTVDASGSAARVAVGAAPASPGWSAGLVLTVPLFEGGSGVAAARAEGHRLSAAELDLEEQTLQLQSALVAAEARLSAARAGLQAQEKANEAAAEAWLLVDERTRNGLSGIGDWMNARRATEEAAVGLARAQAAVAQAVAAVEAARGVW